jgi:hypothetical protein
MVERHHKVLTRPPEKTVMSLSRRRDGLSGQGGSDIPSTRQRRGLRDASGHAPLRGRLLRLQYHAQENIVSITGARFTRAQMYPGWRPLSACSGCCLLYSLGGRDSLASVWGTSWWEAIPCLRPLSGPASYELSPFRCASLGNGATASYPCITCLHHCWDSYAPCPSHLRHGSCNFQAPPY